MAHSATVQADMEIETTIENAPSALQSLRKPPTTKVRLIVEEPELEKVKPKQSKWAKVAEEIEALNISHETGVFIRETSKEFRSEF